MGETIFVAGRKGRLIGKLVLLTAWFRIESVNETYLCRCRVPHKNINLTTHYYFGILPKSKPHTHLQNIQSKGKYKERRGKRQVNINLGDAGRNIFRHVAMV